ncbi:hypothetical protein AB0D34_15680 [Streptomyces sp. NPDC048420]|uniref:hypothetical protein n=1 Tax=Streptomyces sp. NPDC048420 TaxID=3155755 RepID=UPI00344A9734
MNRYVVLPEVATGAAVPDVLARLRERCLDVQYASVPGGAAWGTVRWIEIPVAGHAAPVAELPPTDDPGRGDPDRATPSSRTRPGGRRGAW